MLHEHDKNFNSPEQPHIYLAWCVWWFGASKRPTPNVSCGRRCKGSDLRKPTTHALRHEEQNSAEQTDAVL